MLTHTSPWPPAAGVGVVAAAVVARVAGVAFGLLVRFSAGVAEAAAVVAAPGAGEVAGVAFGLRVGFAVGEGEAASAAGEAALVASAFLWCFAGDGDVVGVGD